jgi:AraC-like DNA-binding protein
VKEYGWKSIDHIQSFLQHAPQLPGALIQSESERFQTRHIIDLLLHDLGQMDTYNQDLRRYFVNALIVLVTRNIGKEKPAQLDGAAGSRIQEIVGYIRANINNPELLKASAIGKQFGISETYLGTFFKHHSGETIQSFISRYKLRQIEHRLRYSDMRVGEIAVEFGFADESHLNKFFKKHRSLNLTEFRKKSRTPPFQPTDANRISNLENFQ